MYESGIHDEIFNKSNVDKTHDSIKQSNGMIEINTASKERSVSVAPTQIREVPANKNILECATHETGIHDESFNESNDKERPKILQEFKKRIDVDLAFFYCAGTKQRFMTLIFPHLNKSFLSSDFFYLFIKKNNILSY